MSEFRKNLENAPEQPQLEQKSVLPDWLKMYEIPGQDKITAHSYLRYLQDKKDDQKMENAEELSASNIINYQDVIKSAPEEKRDQLREKAASFIEQEFTSGNIENYLNCAWMINRIAPEEKRTGLQEKLAGLIEKGFSEKESQTYKFVNDTMLGRQTDVKSAQEIYAELIRYAPRDKITKLIEMGLSSPDIKAAKECAFLISYTAPENDRPALIDKVGLMVEQSFNEKDEKLQQQFSEWVQILPENKRAEIIGRGLDSENLEVQLAYAKGVDFRSNPEYGTVIKKKIASLIEKGLDNEDKKVRLEWIKKIGATPKETRASLMKKALETGDLEIQKQCTQEFWCLSADEKPYFIEYGLSTDNADIQKACAGYITSFSGYYKGWGLDTVRQGLPEEQKIELGKKLALIIEHHISSGNPKDLETYMEMIEFAAEDKRALLIEYGLASDNLDIQKMYANLIWSVPDDMKKNLFEMAKKKMGDKLIEPQIYKDGDISDEDFSRKEFVKTGSGTTLVGGDLKGKTIIRHITPNALLTWQGLFEDHDFWKKQGLDYVPIEPIHSFKLKKNGLVDVYSGVLDLNLDSWRNMGGDFIEELEQDKVNIIRSIDKRHIEHGHTHEGNFCLKFYKDENGHVDFSKKPRIYLIDFDQAISTGR